MKVGTSLRTKTTWGWRADTKKVYMTLVKYGIESSITVTHEQFIQYLSPISDGMKTVASVQFSEIPEYGTKKTPMYIVNKNNEFSFVITDSNKNVLVEYRIENGINFYDEIVHEILRINKRQGRRMFVIATKYAKSVAEINGVVYFSRSQADAMVSIQEVYDKNRHVTVFSFAEKNIPQFLGIDRRCMQ